MNKERFGTIRIKEEHVFLLIFVLLTMVYFFSVPMFRVPDEKEHFLRAYEVSLGYMVSDLDEEGYGGRDLPDNIDLGIVYREATMQTMKEILAEGETLSASITYARFWNTALYSPITYMPQAIGIAISRLFTKKVILLMYAARLGNCLFAMTIGYLAIRFTPICKKTMMSVFLIPMGIQEMISCAPDMAITALALGLFSFVFYMIYSYEGQMKTRHFILMCFLAIWLSMYKVVYVPVCLFLFLIPAGRFGSSKKKGIWAGSLIGVVVALELLWIHITGAYMNPVEFNDPNQPLYMLGHPLEYLQALFLTFKDQGISYIDQAFGMSLGYYDIPQLPKLIFAFELCVLLLGIFETEKIFPRGNERVISLIAAALVVFLMCTGLYIQWNPLGAERVNGIQGRYFLPVIVLLVYPFKICFRKIKPSAVRTILVLAVLLGLNLLVIKTGFRGFWGI